VGEGPGFDEDHQGRPFIGKAGQLLTKIIEAMKFSREEVYIANIVKCHPMINPKNPELRGNDRPPEKEETETCMPYLLEQIELIDPEIICTLGNPSSQALLGTPETISKIRGRIFEFRGRKLIPTYHPAALLRNPGLKAPVWSDMKLLMANLSKPK
jgi:uracil-DNA glycosylase